MRVTPFVALLALCASSCSSVEWSPPSASADALGGPGADVAVFDFSNAEYFEMHPDGTVTVRSAYQETIGTLCDVGWGRSCPMEVGLSKGARCFCKSVWGPIWGHAS